MTEYNPPAYVRMEWAEVQQAPCDYCGAPAGERCENRATGNTFQHGPGHHARIVAFEKWRNA